MGYDPFRIYKPYIINKTRKDDDDVIYLKKKHKYEQEKEEDDTEFLISFYKGRYLHFLKIGIGNYTEHNTKVTSTLIKATANRLDQLIKGRITWKNRNNGAGRYYIPLGRFDSNRSFGWNHTSRFRYSDLDLKQQHSIDCPTEITETYIDKYTTAYRTIGEYE